MSEVFSKVLDYWRKADVSLAPALKRNEVEQRLSSAGLVVGSDFIDFYSIAGGMVDEDCNLWSCWSIERIVEENRAYSRSGVLFADWCINSYLYVLRRETESRSSVWVDFFNDKEPQKVSGSLNDFFERYLAKDETIFILFE